MTKERTLTEYQKRVDDYISQYKEGYFPPLEQIASLSEELGELSREVQHVYGQKKKKPSEERDSIEEECGDLFFTLVCFANAEGIRLDEVLLKTLHKFETRDKTRFTRKDELQ